MKKSVLLLSLMFFLSSPSIAQRTQAEPDSLTLNVSVENALFSPVAKSSEGVIFRTEVKNAKKTKLWFLTIRNSENNKKTQEFIVKKSPLPEKVIWDGQTSEGDIAPDGQYSYKFFVQAGGRSIVVEQSNIITIDSTPPFVSLKCDHDVCFVNEKDGKFSRNLVIYLSAGDENGIDLTKSYLEVLSYNEKRIKVFLFDHKIPEFIVWDGIDEVYNMPLPLGNYKVNFVVADKAGNTSQIDSEISIVPMPKEQAEPSKAIEVKAEERGLVINLSSKVLFDIGQSSLKSEAEKALVEVAEILQVYSKNKVLIEGHTDASGQKEKNMQLSIDRAQSVFDFLTMKGVDGSRMQVFGFGQDKPIASNDSEKGREQNRRVEVVILKTEEKHNAEMNQLDDAEIENEENEDIKSGEESSDEKALISADENNKEVFIEDAQT